VGDDGVDLVRRLVVEGALTVEVGQ
jgi:hypothetical protein